MTRRTLIVATSAALVVIAAIAVTLILLNRSDDGRADPIADHERNAVYACSLLADLPDPLGIDHLSAQEPHLHRVGTAGMLAKAAALQNDDWHHLSDHADDVVTAYMTLNFDQLASARESIQQQCTDLPVLAFPGDVQLGCLIVDALPESIDSVLDSHANESVVSMELSAIGTLGFGAQLADDGAPAGFTTPTVALLQSVQMLNLNAAAEALDELRGFCVSVN